MINQHSQQTQEHFQPITTFILKIYAILSQPQNASAIAWHSDGNCFTIKDIHKFTKEVLPRYFRHHKYESFIRQLNMYNFSKVKTVEGSCFANQHFLKGRDDLLKLIKRKPQRKKKRLNNLEEVVTEQNKENNIKMISQTFVPEKTKDKKEDECLPSNTCIKHGFPVIQHDQLLKHVSFAAEVKEKGEQNLSTLMEPSCKWIASKEDSYWQNIKSYKSIKYSMNFLPFNDQISAVNSSEPKLRSSKSKKSIVSFKELNDN